MSWRVSDRFQDVPVAEVGMGRDPVIRPFVALLFTLTALAGCSGVWHVWSPDRPENLSADFHRDIFGQWGVFLQWTETNGSEDIGFTVYRDGAEIAVVEPECLEWDDNFACTDFRMYTSYFHRTLRAGIDGGRTRRR